MDIATEGPLEMPAEALQFDPKLIRKYDGFGPRYTSYPTADRFHDGFGAADYVESLRQRNEQRRRGLSDRSHE